MDKTFTVLAAAFGFFSVAFGAFGAHALRQKLSADMLAVYQTAVQYQQIHALALLGTAWAAGRFLGVAPTIAGWSFVVGMVIFSGSLYALSLSGIHTFGAITPIGGLAFLVGWAALFMAALSPLKSP